MPGVREKWDWVDPSQYHVHKCVRILMCTVSLRKTLDLSRGGGRQADLESTLLHPSLGHSRCRASASVRKPLMKASVELSDTRPGWAFAHDSSTRRLRQAGHRLKASLGYRSRSYSPNIES